MISFILIWSPILSSSNWFCIYYRIAFSFFPTVSTKYPLAVDSFFISIPFQSIRFDYTKRLFQLEPGRNTHYLHNSYWKFLYLIWYLTLLYSILNNSAALLNECVSTTALNISICTLFISSLFPLFMCYVVIWKKFWFVHPFPVFYNSSEYLNLYWPFTFPLIGTTTSISRSFERRFLALESAISRVLAI